MARGNGWELLSQEDRAALERLLEDGTDTLDRRAYNLSKLSILRVREESGDEQARRLLDAMSYTGLYQEQGKLAKRPTSVFKDSTTGRILNYPKVGSIPVLNQDGTKTGARQLKIWEEMTREQFMEWVDQQVHFAESMRFKVRGLLRVVAAWAKFPHAVNAGHACILAGIDPEEIEFEDAA